MSGQYYRFEAPFVLERDADTLFKPSKVRGKAGRQKANDNASQMAEPDLEKKLAKVAELLAKAKRGKQG